MIPESYEELLEAYLELKNRFEEHEHNGIDSKSVAATFQSQGTLTAQDSATVDATYGIEEVGVIGNNRTRIAEIESALQAVGILD